MSLTHLLDSSRFLPKIVQTIPRWLNCGKLSLIAMPKNMATALATLKSCPPLWGRGPPRRVRHTQMRHSRLVTPPHKRKRYRMSVALVTSVVKWMSLMTYLLKKQTSYWSILITLSPSIWVSLQRMCLMPYYAHFIPCVVGQPWLNLTMSIT